MMGRVRKQQIPIWAVFMAALLAASLAEAISCGTVVTYLSPCVPYMTSRGPLGGCCGGIKGLLAIARTTPARQSVCTCLKYISRSYRGANYYRISGLPGVCGVTLPYRISPNINCASVK